MVQLDDASIDLAVRWLGDLFHQSDDAVACTVYVDRPVLFVNLVYFVVVDVGFYVIYLLQSSTWLIDPHWQLLPTSIALFYYSHPHAAASPDGHHPRALLTLVLVLVWAARLLHNYLRREQWRFGEREDWRYADMRAAHGRWWLVSQFFAVSLAQRLVERATRPARGRRPVRPPGGSKGPGCSDAPRSAP